MNTATIQKISSIEPNTESDENTEFTEIVNVLGKSFIVKKGMFNVGDLCIYYSEGFVLPIDIILDYIYLCEGDDVSEIFKSINMENLFFKLNDSNLNHMDELLKIYEKFADPDINLLNALIIKKWKEFNQEFDVELTKCNCVETFDFISKCEDYLNKTENQDQTGILTAFKMFFYFRMVDLSKETIEKNKLLELKNNLKNHLNPTIFDFLIEKQYPPDFSTLKKKLKKENYLLWLPIIAHRLSSLGLAKETLDCLQYFFKKLSSFPKFFHPFNHFKQIFDLMGIEICSLYLSTSMVLAMCEDSLTQKLLKKELLRVFKKLKEQTLLLGDITETIKQLELY